MAIDLTSEFKVVLTTDQEEDITGGGIAEGGAGSFYLKLSNNTASAIIVQPIMRGTGANPVAADLIHPKQTIEPDGWALFKPVKMGEGRKLWVTANGELNVELTGRKEG